MKIPKKFKLYGQEINIKFNKSINDKCMGKAIYTENTIELATNIKSKSLLEQTYIHELLHFVILHSKLINSYELTNGKKVHEDEVFIDNVASLLHQALVSSEGSLFKKS